MKLILLSLALATAACSHISRDTRPIPAFESEKVCSAQSLAYLKKTSTGPAGKKHTAWNEQVSKLQPLVHQCFIKELDRRPSYQGFNLCLIADYNAKGVQEYFDFSTTEVVLSGEFLKCLNDLRSRPEIQGFKEAVFVQPFKLHVQQ